MPTIPQKDPDQTETSDGGDEGRKTADDIAQAVPGAMTDLIYADLADLASVRHAAQELRDRHLRIDVLINNAGIHATAPCSANGFDHMLAVNYLAPFLLTNLLLDELAAAPARIIIVASEAHRLAGRFDPERFEDLGDYRLLGSFRAYGRTKLLDILFAAELARRTAGTGITANSLCPGTVATGLYAQLPVLRAITPALAHTPFVHTAEQGARKTVRLACDPSVADISAHYFTSTPGLGLLPPVRARRDRQLGRRVWERTADLLGLAT
ncbi:MAG: SDR family NAD(P)-dependent oxidoreductase [Actinobacteria bacterium]|nr:SDR family NAD(P)-dependent oxidoreductase [Actinomycetota bacterium]